MDRRSFLKVSGATGTGLLLAGCNGTNQQSPTAGEPTDLLETGAVRIEGKSVDNPQDSEGNVEYYRAVASVFNASDGPIQYLSGTMEFRDANGSVLETVSGSVVGLPKELRWGFIGEYGGDDPGAVAEAVVTAVVGYTELDLANYQEAGDVSVSNVKPEANEETNEVTVNGSITNGSGGSLEPVQVFVNLWAAEDRVIASAVDRIDSLGQGETASFSASYQFSPHSGHLLPVVTDQNEPSFPFITGETPFSLE